MPKIPDTEIPNTEPETLIREYSYFVRGLAQRYQPILERTGAVDSDDLEQVGTLALLTAQKKYDPSAEYSFAAFSAWYIKKAMRHELGFKQNGTLPPAMEYLDEPLKADDPDADSRLDFIKDPDGKTPEELSIEEAEKQEVKEIVSSAINRLKNKKHREIIQRVHLDGEPKAKVAESMGISVKALLSNDLAARHKLLKDSSLQQYVIPTFRVGIKGFKTSLTSVVERTILWKESKIDEKYGEGAFAAMIRRE